MKTPVFTGSSVAIVTPFCETGVDFNALGKLIDFQIENGTDAITICGTTGESATMNDEEHRACIEYSVKHVAGRVPVIAGTGSNDTAYALELSQHAESVGADALLLVTPYYNKTTQRGLVKHYTYIADRVKTPMILYNVPSRTGLCFTADSYLELSRHPNINGIKEASGNFTLIAQTMALCGANMNVWSGNDDQTVAMLALGAKGVISVAANIIPRVMHDMCTLFFEGNVSASAALQLQYFELINELFVEVNPIPVKTALGLMGYTVGELRMPLCDMAPKNLELLKNAMRKAGLLIVD